MKTIYNSISKCLLALAAILTCFIADAMPSLKGTYDCLKTEYCHFSPYFGAFAYETGFLSNIYHFGPQNGDITYNLYHMNDQGQMMTDKERKAYTNKTVALVRSLFNENAHDGQFIPSKMNDVKCITPVLLGTILGHMLKGDLEDKNVQKEIIGVWAKLAQTNKKGDIEKKLKLIINSCKECDSSNKDALFPQHTTQSILLGFLYAKYLTDSEAQQEGKTYFCKYLTALNNVFDEKSKVLKKDIIFDEKFLADSYPAKQYEDFELFVSENSKDYHDFEYSDSVESQIDLLKNNVESALNALVMRRFFASAVPKQVIQSSFGFMNQSEHPDCLDSALLDFLVSLILYNPVSKEFDLSLLPNGINIQSELKNLMVNGIDVVYNKTIKNEKTGTSEIITETENIKLTPLTINNSHIRQAWYNLVSGHKDLIYCQGRTDARYEIDTYASNVLKLANFLYGIDAKNFEELGKKLSTENRIIEFEGPQEPLKEGNDSNGCKIIMDINNGAVKATLKLDPGHGELDVPVRNSSLLDQYYHKDIGQKLIKDGLSTSKDHTLLALFADKNLLNDGTEKIPLVTLCSLYYNLNMNDPNMRVNVVCDMITQLKYYPKLATLLKELIDGLQFDDQFKNTVATALLNEFVKNKKAIKYDDWQEYLELLTKDPSQGLLKACGCNRSYIDAVKYLVETKKADIEIKDSKEKTPLMHACAKGNLEIIKYLAETMKADSAVMDDAGRTLLMSACENNHFDVVRYLIEIIKVDPDKSTKYRDGGTVLLNACGRGNLELIRYLIEKAKANINAKNWDGDTAFTYAAVNGHIELVKYLVEMSTLSISMKNSLGNH